MAIAYFVSASVLVLIAIGLGILYWWKYKHPIDLNRLNNSNWFLKWLRTNSYAFIVLGIAMCVIGAISLYVLGAQTL